MLVFKMQPHDARILAQIASEDRVRKMLQEIADETATQSRSEDKRPTANPKRT